MIDSRPTVRLTDLKDPAKVAAYFASSLVDVAWVDSVGVSCADLLLEDVDLHIPDDRKWITDILRTTLAECEEAQARIVFLSNAPR